jgi:V8-like Glu-specific endopeptidase
MIVDPPPGTPVPEKGKPGSGSGTGASWTGGGLVLANTGKVLFTLNNVDYVCSGSVVTNTQSRGRSIVLTAGHCVNDGNGGAWATNWMFVPDFQDSSHDFNCATTASGCWTAETLVTSSAWADDGDFDYDVAFAIVGPGGKDSTSNTDLDSVGDQAIAFTTTRTNTATYSFGYPQARPYTGNVLSYCTGTTTLDTYSYDYGLACGMTGGSSGGPWYRDFNATTGVGTTVSLNSFKYRGDKTTMYGPLFGNYAQAVYAAASNYSGADSSRAVSPPSALP